MGVTCVFAAGRARPPPPAPPRGSHPIHKRTSFPAERAVHISHIQPFSPLLSTKKYKTKQLIGCCGPGSKELMEKPKRSRQK